MRFNAALCVALALSVSSPGVSAQSTDVQTRWAGTWGASPSPQLADNAAMEKAKLTFTNQTIREIVHISIGGSTIRVRLSNTYGKDAVQIGAAHVALRSKASAIVSGSDHQLTFGGHSSITIPPNALVLSDPLPINLASSSDLAISIFLPKSTLGAGIHYAAQQTNYIGSGDLTTAVDMPDATTITSWVFLSGVDVSATQPSSALITFGDSITDGARSANDTNHRWPDFLATRLLAQKSTARIGVLNEGIGGNRILHDPNEEIRFGVNALARFDRDVLSQPGVKYIIVMEGINDLGHAGPDHFPTEQVTAEDLIVGYKQLIARAHERGIKIYGATMTPFTGVTFNGYYSDQKELIRKSVNTWMRTSHAFDAVIDFDKAVQDRADPDHIAAAYDSGDHLHPKDEGYKAMADSIDLSLFK